MLSPQLRIRAALVLIALGALGTARALPRAVHELQAAPKLDATAPFVARFEKLRPHVRETQWLGYLSPAENLDPRRPDPAKRLYLAQFALAPCVVERRTDRDVVIFDSDAPDATPDIAILDGWTLLADLRNGVKLFSTGRSRMGEATPVAEVVRFSASERKQRPKLSRVQLPDGLSDTAPQE